MFDFYSSQLKDINILFLIITKIVYFSITTMQLFKQIVTIHPNSLRKLLYIMFFLHYCSFLCEVQIPEKYPPGHNDAND